MKSWINLLLMIGLLAGYVLLPQDVEAQPPHPNPVQPIIPEQPDAVCNDGTQTSGALYRICMPNSNWNGELVVYAHGYVAPDDPLAIPAEASFRSTGKRGLHSEHMGYLLAEMQYLQRAYPGGAW